MVAHWGWTFKGASPAFVKLISTITGSASAYTGLFEVSATRLGPLIPAETDGELPTNTNASAMTKLPVQRSSLIESTLLPVITSYAPGCKRARILFRLTEPK